MQAGVYDLHPIPASPFIMGVYEQFPLLCAQMHGRMRRESGCVVGLPLQHVVRKRSYRKMFENCSGIEKWYWYWYVDLQLKIFEGTVGSALYCPCAAKKTSHNVQRLPL